MRETRRIFGLLLIINNTPYSSTRSLLVFWSMLVKPRDPWSDISPEGSANLRLFDYLPARFTPCRKFQLVIDLFVQLVRVNHGRDERWFLPGVLPSALRAQGEPFVLRTQYFTLEFHRECNPFGYVDLERSPVSHCFFIEPLVDSMPSQ